MRGETKNLAIIADDDASIFTLLKNYLQSWGWRATWASNKDELLQALSKEPPCLLLLDLCFGEDNGLEILQDLMSHRPELIVALLTGNGTIDCAVSAIKMGAYDFLSKPIDFHRLRVILEHATEKQSLNHRIKSLSKLVKERNSSRQLLGNAPALHRIMEVVDCIAATDATVLILGESGTGKELVARALHERSQRQKGPFVVVNTTALPRDLVESILFGHEKGAFTGADSTQLGCFEKAEGGTLFLDEIGDMELRAQSRLLRFLQERTFERIGSGQTRSSNVRVVAATNRNLPDAIRKGEFREDLYYRLNVVPIELPPLRERREDIPHLATHFLARAALNYGKNVDHFTPEALAILSSHDWPGNVRQLENLVERLVLLCGGPEIGPDLIPPEIRSVPARLPEENASASLSPIEKLERQAIVDALARTQCNVSKAARNLGLSQATVYRKIKHYGLQVNRRSQSGTRVMNAAAPV